MPTFFLRVWLPDRPGALGLVASRVGAVGGDVVGIDIIERGAGRAVDELLIRLPDRSLVDLLVGEIREIDGADVEDIREAGRDYEDVAVASLQVAADLARSSTESEVAAALVTGAVRVLHADWAALVDVEACAIVAGEGDDLPNDAWLAGFVRGTSDTETQTELEEFAMAPLPSRGWSLVVCRGRLPIRGRERLILSGLAALG